MEPFFPKTCSSFFKNKYFSEFSTIRRSTSVIQSSFFIKLQIENLQLHWNKIHQHYFLGNYPYWFEKCIWEYLGMIPSENSCYCWNFKNTFLKFFQNYRKNLQMKFISDDIYIYIYIYIYSFIGVTHLVRIQSFRKNQPFLTPYTHKYEVLQIFLSVWPTFLAYCFQAIYYWELLFHPFF